MTISCREVSGEIWLVDAQGRLDQSLNPQLEKMLTGLIDEGQTRLIVDLSQSNYINSGGLRCLVTAWREAQEKGGDLVLCGLSGRIQEIFNMIGFDRVFSIHPTSEDALNHFQL